MRRCLARFVRQPIDKIGVDGAFGQNTRPSSRQSDQVSRSPLDDGEEGLIYGGHQKRTPCMRREGGCIIDLRGQIRIAPQGAAQASALTELRCKLTEHGGRREIGASAGDLSANEISIGELLEQRHNVSKALVKRTHIGVRWFPHCAGLAIQQRMSCLMSDNVSRQTGEHHGAWRRQVGHT